ncbi:unnamed protein product [Porites lobata]|uniref:FGF n=1 Tax=Porites lobata TaxID=104759 RepID=A0ABN8MMY3_9CNID|nr:unnamed protein product [Porites lobata]
MNFGGLLLLMLQICYCTERCTSAKPDNATREQYKEGKPDSVPSSATRHKPKKSLRTFLYKKQKWPQPSGEIFLKRVRKITKLPTTSTHCKIFCRSGYHLQILPNGVVKGTLDQDSKYVVFEMQSFGTSLVRLKSITTGRYLTMRRNGTLRGLRNQNKRDSLFKETHEQNAFHSYASHRYFRRQPHDMLVGIKRNGQIKRATKTLHGQTATQFLVIKL